MASQRIIVIDDDAELCEEIAEFLRDAGHFVKNTSDTLEGEALLESHQFDVALLDFKMKGSTGIDMLRKIRCKDSKMKIFIMTGRPFIEKLLEEEKMAHMVEGIISKPFKEKVLLNKISEACDPADI